MHSIINRSPLELVKEIILVDDASQKEHLKKKLENYIEEKSKEWENKVRVIRLKERDGLIGARLAGARNATAEVLIFLDSHIEVRTNCTLIYIMAINILILFCILV